MKKNYLLLCTLFLISINNLHSQGPWTFTNSNDGWASTGTAANLTTSATYSVLDVNGAGNPQITRTDASVDGTTNKYAVIRIKNNTSNTLMRFIYNTSGTNRFTNTQISANDSEFKTYYVKVDSNADWNTNPVNTITIQFKADHNNTTTTAVDDGLGNFYIDNFEIVAAEISRTDFVFENPNDDGGIVTAGGASLNQNATTGVYELDTNEKQFPGIALANTFKVPATTNNFVAITFDTNTATNANQVTFKSENPTNEFTSKTITESAGVQQTVVIDLTSKSTWDGDETTFGIQFRYQNGGATSFPDNQVINIHRILFFNTQWTGNGDTDADWNTATNWSTGAVPTATDVVYIPSGLTNNPIVSATTGAVTNDLIIDGSLTIENGGSLIVNGTSSGNVTYNRTLDFVSGNTNGWHLVSSPLAGEVFDNTFATSNSIASGNSNNLGLATYNTADNDWTYLQSPSGSVSSTSGIGYSMKRSATGTVAFTGIINTDDVKDVTISTSGDGFNLLGVPYTSYISSQIFLDDNSNLDQTQIWVWKQGVTSGSYITMTAKGDNFILAPGQGFFVKASSGTAVNFIQSNQTANADTFQKSSRTEVKLLINDGEIDRFAKLYYVNNVTKGFDAGWEGETFSGIKNSFDVFSHLVEDNLGKSYQVQSLPISEMETIAVPIGVQAEAGKEITFTTKAINLPEGVKVFLEDRLHNTFTRLDEANTECKITLTEALNGTGRFYLYTKTSSVLSLDSNLLNNVSIYKTTNSNLKIIGLSQGKTSVFLYNVLGKQVMKRSFDAVNINNISLPNLATGVYIVKLENASGSLNKKIILE